MPDPKSLGYRMPAEWEPHEGTWLSWPHNPRTWPNNFGPIPAVFVRIVEELCPHERVNICVCDALSEAGVRKLLKEADVDSEQVFFYHIPTNDAWARDHGPVFVTQQPPPKAAADTKNTAADITAGVAAQLGLKVVDLSTLEIPAAVLQMIPAGFCRQNSLIPIALFEDVLTVAVADPYDMACLDRLRELVGCQVEMAVALPADIEISLARHYGPPASDSTVMARVPSRLAILDWKFNSWGEKYAPWDDDDAVPEKVARQLRLPCFHPRMVLEGGSIEVNGLGTLLTTESVLLNPNRNPALSKKQIEARLDEYLAARNVIWLNRGIVGDDTDGHIDDLTRFVNPATLATVVEEDETDENYGVLRENLERLQSARDQDGRKFEIVPLPSPGKVYGGGAARPEERLPASYANFYIGNSVVIVPVFGHKNDAKALGILGELFPKRAIVGIDCHDLVGGYGAIHCVTQQQPS